MELTQKSRSRIKEKMKQFFQLPEYKFVLYLFQRPSIFETYKDDMQFLDKNPYKVRDLMGFFYLAFVKNYKKGWRRTVLKVRTDAISWFSEHKPLELLDLDE